MFARDIRRRLTTWFMVLGVGGAGPWGCGVGPAPERPADAVSDPVASLGRSEAELYVSSSSLWQVASIPVCWENNDNFWDFTKRMMVRSAVVRTWEARSGVRFTGWEACEPNAQGIRIFVGDEGPHVKALGNRLNAMPEGMVLNFTFDFWGPFCRDRLQYCIEAIAVHEFGHAMGYAHEQDRPDHPSWCTESQRTGGDLLIGPWDIHSVMNYCNPQWNGDGNLSATDVQGAQATYGVPWFPLGGVLTSGPAVSSWGPGRLDVFARGPDNALLHKWYDGTWHDWEWLGGMLASDPAAVSWGPGRIDVFARHLNNTLVHKSFNGSWSDWEPLGGVLTSGPAVSSRGPGRLDVFVRGSDSALYHREFNGAWQGWQSLGGALLSAPAAVSWGPGRVDVFARGMDNSLAHKWFEGGWSGWESLGGSLSVAPTVSSWGPGRLDVFAGGNKADLHQLTFNGGWGGWQWLGGQLASAPAAVSWGQGRLDIFYTGPDGALRQSVFNNGW